MRRRARRVVGITGTGSPRGSSTSCCAAASRAGSAAANRRPGTSRGSWIAALAGGAAAVAADRFLAQRSHVFNALLVSLDFRHRYFAAGFALGVPEARATLGDLKAAAIAAVFPQRQQSRRPIFGIVYFAAGFALGVPEARATLGRFVRR